MSSSVPPLVRVATARGVSTITLDSPANRNALSVALIDQLRAAILAADADAAVRVIVLSHTGPVFCSGADLTETTAMLDPARGSAGDSAGGSAGDSAGGSAGDSAADEVPLPVARLADLLATLWAVDKPVLARVGGPVRAGGLGLVAAADLAVCADSANFAFPEVRLGLVAAVISAVVLPRLTSRAAARLLLTGSIIEGPEAEWVGLVTASVPADGLDDAVDGYLTLLTRGGPGALAATKRLLRGPDEPAAMRARLTSLAAASTGFFAGAEGREGMAAHAAKRDPAWVPGL